MNITTDVRGRAPSLDDYEGNWESYEEKDDTFLDTEFTDDELGGSCLSIIEPYAEEHEYG